MFRKISLLSLGSMAMVCCLLFSIGTMASKTSTKNKFKSSSSFSSIEPMSIIAELYVNATLAYFPVTNSESFSLIKKSEKNPEILVSKSKDKIMVTKDDYNYYFLKSNEKYVFSYALKDNNIPLYDGYEYENITKILIGNQVFNFSMLNGRPVGLVQQSSN